MKHFEHIDAVDLPQALTALQSETQSVQVIAGGTDLLSVLKRELKPEYPDMLVNLKTIDGLGDIEETDQGLKIGATARLSDISTNPLVTEKYPALAAAARSVATPLLRNIATIGGNLCQEVRCWYYRYPNEIGGRIECARKGGELCNAMLGENRNHSIFGAAKVQDTPCTRRCPAGTDIPAYAARLREGDIEGAAEIILEVNPMPAITSRVCSHFCQEKCNRSSYDESVNIGSLERHVGDYILEHPERFFNPPSQENGKQVAVVGSGPAGLTAAYFLRRLGYTVTVYDKMPEAGGLLRYAIPHYRLPKHYVQQTVASLERMGIGFKLNTEVGRDVSVDSLLKSCDSVFLNTGAWKRPVIGLDGEDLTTFGLDFLIEVNKWMKDKIDRDVVVVGGGNVAVDVAITAKRMGAAKVTMACLECEDAMPASAEEIARAKEEGIVIMPGWGPKEVLRDGDKITGLSLKRCTCVFDEKGRFAPQYDESQTRTVEGSSILMAVGQTTDLSFLGDELALEINRGLISVNQETQETNIAKLFAVGDVTTGPKTVIDAIADGKKAAYSVAEFVSGSRPQLPETERGFLRFDPQGCLKQEAVRLPERPMEERSLNAEDSFSADAEAILTEAKRCFNCGCLAVNPSDIATVLMALDADIITSKRQQKASAFFENPCGNYIDKDELVLSVTVPKQTAQVYYDKFRVRESHDFAVVSVAAAYELEGKTIRSARIILGAVAPVPMRAEAAEALLVGKQLTAELAAKAAEAALADAIPLEHNVYKVQVAQSMVEKSLLQLL